MKNIFILLIKTLMYSCQNNNPSQINSEISSSEKQAVENLILAYFDDIWSSFDTTKIEHYHSKDFILFEHGQEWTKEKIKDYMLKQLEKGDLPTRKNKMDFLFVEKLGDKFSFAYRNSANITRADTLVADVQWLESGIAIMNGNDLQLEFLHSTWVPPSEN